MNQGPRRVVVTGTSTLWGAELARRLARDRSVEAVFGLDTEPPPFDLGPVELIEADVRSPLLAKLLPTTGADTVAHCAVHWYPAPGKPARSLHDINVVGTLQLLAACERLPQLQRVVVRGSAAIYGCEGAAPQLYTEDLAGRFPLKTRFQRDIGELEGYFDNFARRRPEIACCMLRFQPELGPELDTPLARYLSLPVVPVQLGFDPRLQFVHSEDAHGALLAAVFSAVRGAVNVAPNGSISLSRALRLCRRPALPIAHPLFAPAMARLGRRLGVADLYGDAVRLLRYGRGVDNTRLIEELGYEPLYPAAEVVRDFAVRSTGLRIAAVPHLGSVLEPLGGGRP